MTSIPRSRALLFAATAFLLVAGFRVVRAVFFPDLPNFSPVPAMALSAAAFLPGWSPLALVLGIVVISDAALAVALGFPLLTPGQMLLWGALVLIFALGKTLPVRSWGFFSFSLALMGGSMGFYLLANSVSWLADPGYSKSLAGWWQAQTIGLPGFPPAWMFLRNSLLSDLLFGSLFFAFVHRTSLEATAPRTAG